MKKGADLNLRDNDGRNVLHYASITNDYSDLILYFIDKGVNHKSRDNKGNKPIDLIKKNDVIEKNSDAYWKLHDLNFE